MCWVAVDRGARLAAMIGAGRAGRRVGAGRRRDQGRHPRARRRRARGADAVLRQRRRWTRRCCWRRWCGSCRPDDPRIRATVLAIADELTDDGLVLRYRVEETDDGFTGEEGSFTICSFWLVSALCEIGEHRAGPRAVRQAAVLRRPARALRRGDRRPHRPAPRQLPAGVHPPGADQRRAARHRRRADRRPGHVTSPWGPAGGPRGDGAAPRGLKNILLRTAEQCLGSARLPGVAGSASMRVRGSCEPESGREGLTAYATMGACRTTSSSPATRTRPARCPTSCESRLGEHGIVLKSKDTWPRTSKVYCHRADGWPDDAESSSASPRASA